MSKAREVDVLRELGAGTGWDRPMDVGGRDGSHHSYTLSRLVKLGLAEREQRSAFGCRGSWVYRITRKGRATLKALEKE